MNNFLRIPKNKFLRLLINVVLIVGWFRIYDAITWELVLSGKDFRLQDTFGDELYWISNFLFAFLPIFFITRYVWFEKSRNRIFYGLFNKFNLNLKNFEPRIYTTTSNADELKKYSELRDKGIITEEEFQTKKKKLLDL
tara:strand:+ start:1622 stop:2038 length:417 start_codon:yes stop_codon:yes gene_type:complete